MAASNWQKCARIVGVAEGGYTNDRRDPGNWTGGKVGKGKLLGTKYGIAANTFPHLDIPNLTKGEAVAIYKKHYWDIARCDDLPVGLDLAVFDFTINSGVEEAVEQLQVLLKAKKDGAMGGNTLARVKILDKQAGKIEQLIEDYLDSRWAFMRSLSNFKVHGGGWKKRIAKIRRLSLSMYKGASVPEDIETSAPARSDKAMPTQEKFTADGERLGTTAGGIGAAGKAATEIAEKIEPISYYSEWIGYIFVALMIFGIIAVIVVKMRKKKEKQGEPITPAELELLGV